MNSVAAKALNYLCLSNTYGSDFVALLNELHLLSRSYHRFILLHLVCMLLVPAFPQAVIRHVNTNVISRKMQLVSLYLPLEDFLY